MNRTDSVVYVGAVVLGLLSVALGAVREARGAIPPDTGYAARQKRAITAKLTGTVPIREYQDTEYLRCVSDAVSLALHLEAHHRGYPKGIAPAEGARIAEHLAGVFHAKRKTNWDSGERGAVLAYSLHRHGRHWPKSTRDALRIWLESVGSLRTDQVLNGTIDMVCGLLLAGEALGKTGDGAALWQRGAAALDDLFEHTRYRHNRELNGTMYSVRHLASLLWLQSLQDPVYRTKARILLESELLVHAHSYLPGGAMLPPRCRDYGGGLQPGRATRLTGALLQLLIGDPQVDDAILDDAYEHVRAGALTDPTAYQVPQVIRSVFLDKGNGYTFRTRIFPILAGIAPQHVYDFGHGPVFPLQMVVLPDGTGGFGGSYGGFHQNIPVLSGLIARNRAGEYGVLYHYQPRLRADKTRWSKTGIVTGKTDNPDSGHGEFWDYQRMIFHRTMLTLWKPGSEKACPDTRAYLPDFEGLGGEYRRMDGWHLGSIGRNYIAFRPLGEVAEEKRVKQGIYLRFAGTSGHVVEMSPAADHASFDAFAREMAARRLAFNEEELWVEYETRDARGATSSIKLQYAPQRRWVDGGEVPDKSFIDRGMMASDFVSWDEAAGLMTLARPGYGELQHDWQNAKISLR
ncbi:MAG: hypothetical protein JXR37_14960 [Kiritimatiellae bacterium]|nr:hypothetical protein [Kiritimatiellia bacterium]